MPVCVERSGKCAILFSKQRIPMAEWWSTPFVHCCTPGEQAKNMYSCKKKSFRLSRCDCGVNQIIQLCFSRSLCYSVAFEFGSCSDVVYMQKKCRTFGSSRKIQRWKLDYDGCDGTPAGSRSINCASIQRIFGIENSKQQIYYAFEFHDIFLNEMRMVCLCCVPTAALSIDTVHISPLSMYFFVYFSFLFLMQSKIGERLHTCTEKETEFDSGISRLLNNSVVELRPDSAWSLKYFSRFLLFGRTQAHTYINFRFSLS